MTGNRVGLDRDRYYKEAFLASLSRRLAVSSVEWPTVRYWTMTALKRLFKQVKAEVGLPKPPQSNLEILEWIEKLGLSCAIKTDKIDFHLFEIGASLQSVADPLELMMAFEPSGVICYFSAIAFHSLTSQVPGHHHVAIFEKPNPLHAKHPQAGEVLAEESNPKLNQTTATLNKTVGDAAVRSKANPLGTKVFSYGDVPFYRTRRNARMVPGIQNRSNGPRGRFRITTFEQTLLDTLHKPEKCGGSAVVLEAWQNALSGTELDEDRLLDYLKQMGYPATTRRLGALFKLLDYSTNAELTNYLNQARENVVHNSRFSHISLLPGFEYSQLDEEWLVKLP
jgi:predicted transcriptional regulator of viral defense system